MSTLINNDKKSDKGEDINIKEDIRDYSKEPCFIEKAEDTAVFIEEYGLPEAIEKKAEEAEAFLKKVGLPEPLQKKNSPLKS